ncbi:MAG: GDCCVxC domain-containing (seleno)protein [Thermodesulfobacteriota bacterium]
MKHNSVIKCPECGFEKVEIMPVNSCRYFYECENCNFVLKPTEGDCCVFCSYGSVSCPSKQEGCCEV